MVFKSKHGVGIDSLSESRHHQHHNYHQHYHHSVYSRKKNSFRHRFHVDSIRNSPHDVRRNHSSLLTIPSCLLQDHIRPFNVPSIIPINNALSLSLPTRRSLKKPRRNAFVLRFPSSASPSSELQHATYFHQSIQKVAQEERRNVIDSNAVSLTNGPLIDQKTTERITNDWNGNQNEIENDEGGVGSTLELMNDFSDLKLGISLNRQQLVPEKQEPT
jgi:hypothetical protein